MEVHFSPDLQAKLSRLAAEQGRDSAELVREAVERLLDYDSWFIREVEKGLAQIEGSKTLTHAEVGSKLEQLIARKQPPV